MCEQAGGPANRTLQVTLAALQGTVFFGCPHPTESHRELWPKLNRLLEYYGKWTASYLAENYQFVAQVTDVSSKFEKTAVGSSILTVYEERDTRVKFWKKSKVSSQEKVKDVVPNIDTNHFSLISFLGVN